jgi:hypothetical protein
MVYRKTDIDTKTRLKRIVILSVFITVAGLLSAQTADEIDTILNTQEITYSQAARFILTAADQADQPIDSPSSPVSLGEVSLLIMRSFRLKGGIFYSLFPSPRYACRELVHLHIIQGRTDPGGRLDGRTFLQILGRVLTYTGEDEALAAAEARRRLLEDVSGSLRDSAGKTQGISSGAEDVQQYEGDFQLE